MERTEEIYFAAVVAVGISASIAGKEKKLNTGVEKIKLYLL